MTPYYASLNTDIARLSVETVETKALENAIAGQGYIQSYAQNGNPPATPQEQNERMQYVTQVALELSLIHISKSCYGFELFLE